MSSSSELSRLEIPRTSLESSFDSWLNSEKADPNDRLAILEDIRKLLPIFAYNQFKLNSDQCHTEFESDGSMGHFIFHDAIDFLDLSSNAGECGQLATKAYILILEKYPELRGYLCMLTGKESQYFTGDKSHLFLALCQTEPIRIMSSGEIAKDAHYVDKHDDEDNNRQYAVPRDIWIIDPSFGMIIDHTKNQQTHLPQSVAVQSKMKADLPIYYENLIPFCNLPDTGFAYLEWTVQQDRLTVRIALKKPGSPYPKSHTIGSQNFETVFEKHPELMRQALLAKQKMIKAVRSSVSFLKT